MFRKLWNALANLTSAVDTLTASVKEANDNFRANLGLDQQDDQPAQLNYEPTTKSRKKTAAK